MLREKLRGDHWANLKDSSYSRAVYCVHCACKPSALVTLLLCGPCSLSDAVLQRRCYMRSNYSLTVQSRAVAVQLQQHSFHSLSSEGKAQPMSLSVGYKFAFCRRLCNPSILVTHKIHEGLSSNFAWPQVCRCSSVDTVMISVHIPLPFFTNAQYVHIKSADPAGLLIFLLNIHVCHYFVCCRPLKLSKRSLFHPRALGSEWVSKQA